MNRQGTLGVAALLALAAAIGFTLNPGAKQGESSTQAQKSPTGQAAHGSASPLTEKRPGCGSIEKLLKEFLATDAPLVPDECYVDAATAQPPKRGAGLRDNNSQLTFVVTTLPDPLHTHMSLSFDQLAVAVQEAAQDEKYEFDSSWLPWEDDGQRYALLADQDAINQRRAAQEEQPGIILFRKAGGEAAGAPRGELLQNYRRGLIVFVVGEDATHGIHRAQFRNALLWMEAIQPTPAQGRPRLAILGPSFSGSFSSLAQLLSEERSAKILNAGELGRLPIYSGSTSSFQSAHWFWNQVNPQVEFHSFVQNDDKILELFCQYFDPEPSESRSGPRQISVAIISEDQTAYGQSGMERGAKTSAPARSSVAPEPSACLSGALQLYYPRDISALRGAYQTKSLFSTGDSAGSPDIQRRNLPTNLADPAGIVRDSVRSYGGNQTPLAQEALLLQIVAALREFHPGYVLLRSSNTLDQLFLTDFLRRMYPNARIVIVASDLLFVRERGATGLNGTLTLSTYPLFPLARDWTEQPAHPAADRAFSADTAEGTYVALRVLLNARGLRGAKEEAQGCHVLPDDENDENAIFLPRVVCDNDPDNPIPDYSLPHWMLKDKCGESKNEHESCPYSGPATWLSVIGQNRFWPLASMRDESLIKEPWTGLPASEPRKTASSPKERAGEPGQRPGIPLGMKLFFIALGAFTVFHVVCCWKGSYTAKPAFRAHFASTGDWRHTVLVLLASCLISFVAMLSGWGCGVFFPAAYGVLQPWLALRWVVFVCFMMWVAIFGHSFSVWMLSRTKTKDKDSLKALPRGFRKRFWVTSVVLLVIMAGRAKDFRRRLWLTSLVLVAAMAGFLLFDVVPFEQVLLLGNRVMTYWRSMHLTSGVSPLVPILSILIGFYITVWLELHGLALFGEDQPRLPPVSQLRVKDQSGQLHDYFRMFSHQDTAKKIESCGRPLNWKTARIAAVIFVAFYLAGRGLSGGVPIRSLGAQRYAFIFFLWLDLCFSLMLAKSWQLYAVWEKLRQLLAFLDRLPLRRSMAALRGFSWGSVWKMSGNVLEVRYKVISSQIESMNHTMNTLQAFEKRAASRGESQPYQELQVCLTALDNSTKSGREFADWYSTSYQNPRAGDLSKFSAFQEKLAIAGGTLLTHLLVPAWRMERNSLILASPDHSEKGEPISSAPPLAKEDHIRNAEELVCLTYLGFIQNILGRLRTIVFGIVTLFIASTVALSTYPFDPRQQISAVLVVLFVFVGTMIVKVYAEMHRDTTLSHVTNSKPGELGAEFWFKVIGFGFAPLIGLLTRIFPGITDFVFSWLQPGISSMK